MLECLDHVIDPAHNVCRKMGLFFGKCKSLLPGRCETIDAGNGIVDGGITPEDSTKFIEMVKAFQSKESLTPEQAEELIKASRAELQRNMGKTAKDVDDLIEVVYCGAEYCKFIYFVVERLDTHERGYMISDPHAASGTKFKLQRKAFKRFE